MTITDDELKHLVMSGKAVEAIKLYRAATGVSLKEAKDHVESLFPPRPKVIHQPKDPDSMTLEELRQEVEDWRHAARYHPKMNGKQFMGWSFSQLDRCRKRYIEGEDA